MKKSILIAGIGGASLGTEIFKSLKDSENYNIFGADISPYAYGLYENGFARTYVVNPNNYIQNIINICEKENIDAIIPGGEEPLAIIGKEKKLFENEGIKLAINSSEIIGLCSDKIKTFDYLKSRGIAVPKTKLITNLDDIKEFNYPCIIKPSTGTGGSVFVCLAEDESEALFYIHYLKKRQIKVVAQEYIPHNEGEYTVGVLSLPNGKIAGSIALKRTFNCKLSWLSKYGDRIISSGYSQGLFEDFKDIRKQAEDISLKIDSRGPLNIQGRTKDGVFYPFEINPRFSASTYLRAMAGFNEVDIFLQFLLEGKYPSTQNIKYGYYFRSFEEKYVSKEKIKK